MGTYRHILITCTGALLAFGSLSACAGESGTAQQESDPAQRPSATSTAFPPSATFIADMEKDGEPMTIGITVEGGDVTAYACNGTDDEAWFFGEQTAGDIDITSRFRDTLQASFDGIDVEGDLTMDGKTYEFTAAPAEPPAGVYTAEADGSRAAWIVRADGSTIGVQSSGRSGRDFGQAELQQLQDAAFRSEVRNKRQLQQAAQLVRLQDGAASSTINGRQVSAARVSGSFRL